MILPFCSVIVLNYNGESVIKNVIDSLLELDYPKNRFEIIIVDNNSKDKSKNIILSLAKLDKRIKTIFLKENAGFSKGNNTGIKAAKGKYILLLNNDCLVDQVWLRELVLVAEKDKKIFAVNPKVLLYSTYIYPRIKVNSNFVVKNAYLTASNLLRYTDSKQISLEAIWPDNPSNRTFILEVPFDKKFDNLITCQINLLTSDSSLTKNQPIKLVSPNTGAIEISYSRNNDVYKAILKIDMRLIPERNKYEKIQNAGILVFQEGSGRDIGAIVRYKKQYYEFDKGQFNHEREVYAVCAVASLYRKEVLDKIGYLDENFFMYYEDVEISERARLHGYKNYYAPKAIARHLHALSSKEWSPFFIFHVEKGRYLHLLYYFPYPIYLFVIGFFRLLTNGIARFMVGSKMKNDHAFNFQYLKLSQYFLISFPMLIYTASRKRSGILKKKLLENLSEIASGRWYFERD